MYNKEHLKILKQGVEVWNEWRKTDLGIIPDLSGVNLSGKDLSGINFLGTILLGANLCEVKLAGADISGADLRESNLKLANLQKVSLEGSNLRNANLYKTNLEDANINNAFLFRANLSEATLNKSNVCRVDLREANLQKTDLREANINGTYLVLSDLRKADLSGADLSNANLSGAFFYRTKLRLVNFNGAHFRGVNLIGVNLRGTDLSDENLSGAIVDEITLFKSRKIKGCQIGINGIWCKETDSAALMTLTPLGNSMQGANPEAVIESLKRARNLHGFSMTLAGSVILIYVLGLEKIKFGAIDIGEITPGNFGLLAMPLTVGILTIVSIFMKDALNGTRYLQDRKSAMTVGSFPWLLNKYTREIFDKIISFFTRLVMTFHPLAYMFYWDKWEVIPKWFFIPLMIFLLILSGLTFLLSEQFQKPILFDRQTEEIQKSEIEKLTEAMKEQTTKIVELIDLFRPIKGNGERKQS